MIGKPEDHWLTLVHPQKPNTYTTIYIGIRPF